MDRLREVFRQGHVVLPVVHVESPEQAARNVDIAREAGADGVFLINHEMPAAALLEIHDEITRRHSGWWIGVNCLDLAPDDVFRAVSGNVAGIWTDNALIHEGQEPQPDAERILAVRKATGWGGLYFGGVAFKYQRHVEDLAAAARAARPYMDVVTTSGPGTGLAAEVGKIRRLREALGGHPLAIASGVTPENVRDFVPLADCFLVATGISRSFTELDPALTKALVEAVRPNRG